MPLVLRDAELLARAERDNPAEPRLEGPPPETLRGRLERVWRAVGAVGPPPFDELIDAWSEPHRRYHTLGHLAALLAGFDRDGDLAVWPAEVEVAIWFHHVVQVPVRPDDETRSAALARRRLMAAGVSVEAAERVAVLIRSTAPGAHVAAPDAALLCDLDLAVLGGIPADYDAYVGQVRAEYGWVSEARWRSGRRAVLTTLLEGGVYRTARLRGRLEEAATANLRRELDGLG